MNKVSLHIHQPGMGIDVLERLRPPMVTVMDADRDLIFRMRAKFPDMHINVRIAEGEGRNWHNTNLHARVDQILSIIRDCPKEKLTVEFFNEPLGHDAKDKAEYDECLAEFTGVMRGFGVEVSGLSLAEGNWTKDGPPIVEDFPKSLALLRYISLHEYWWPRLHAPDMEGYHWRWPYILQQLDAAGLGHIKIIVSECGLCRGAAVDGGPDEGWLSKPDEVSVDSYADDLSQLNALGVQEPRILGFCVFDAWPMGSRFGSFRINDTGLIDRIYSIDAPVSPPEEPPPPPPEEPEEEPEEQPEQPPQEEEPMDDPKVIDLEYNERDFEYVKEKYGVAYRRAEVPPGGKVYRLVELWEKTGTSSLQTNVTDENGNPIHKADVAFYWPDAPDPPDPPTEVYSHDWHRNFIHGPTNANGDVGPGMGKGAYHGTGEGGPHAVWVRDPNIPSDICEKLGMLAGTFHDHLDQKFKLVTVGEEPPPQEPEQSGELEIKERVEEAPWPSAEMVLCYPKDMALDTRGQARIKGVSGDVYDPDLEHPASWDDYYAFVKNCCDFDGDTPRVYQLMVTQYGSEEPITPVVEEEFQPQPDHRRVIFFVDYSGGEQPPVQPPTGDEDVAELWRKLATAKRAEADLCDAMAEKYEG